MKFQRSVQLIVISASLMTASILPSGIAQISTAPAPQNQSASVKVSTSGKALAPRRVRNSAPTAARLSLPLANPAEATAAAGLLDDKKPHLPTNYLNWTPPALGQSYTDSVFGTTITRLSNGLAQLNDAVHHEYSTMSPFNANNTRVLLLTENRGWIVMDMAGKVLLDDSVLAPYYVSEPRWSITDPNVFFYHKNGTNQLLKYDIATKKETLLRQFTQYSEIDFGGGESDISDDGDHLIIRGDDRYIGVYTISTNRLGKTLDINGLGNYDYFDLTADNHVLARWDANGAGRYRGFELYDQEMNHLRQVTQFSAHADRGRDINGDEILLVLAASDLTPPAGCENNGIEKVRLADGRRTCLMGLNWDVGAHISANTNGSNPWVLIELLDENKQTALENQFLPADWQTRWGTYYNEILMVKLDGSEVRRLAHHRSRAMDDYWFQPRAAISRDGSYAVFDSNFGTQPLPSYTDVFLINLNVNQVANMSAASYSTTAIATEAITVAFGSDLATSTLAATTTPLPTTLAGTSVKFRDSSGIERLAPLFYVSPTQINYQVPAGSSLGQAAVTVTNAQGRAATGTISVTNVMPGLFTADASGKGPVVGYVQRTKANGAQTNEAMTRFDAAQSKFVTIPIDLGPTTDQVFLVLFGTGLRYRSALSAVSANIGGTDTTVTFAGAQGFFVGLDQVNIRLPRTLLGRGEIDLFLKVDNKTSNTVKINVK